MRKITVLTIVGLWATVILSGCDMGMTAARAQDIPADKPLGDSEAYLGQSAIRSETMVESRSAVETALEWAKKYAEASAKQNRLQQENHSLVQQEHGYQQKITKLEFQLKRAEAELGEANSMLLEMRGELRKWKTNVMGFRDEMREAQKTQLDALFKILRLVGGELAAEPLTKQATAQRARNEEEKTGETTQ